MVWNLRRVACRTRSPVQAAPLVFHKPDTAWHRTRSGPSSWDWHRAGAWAQHTLGSPGSETSAPVTADSSHLAPRDGLRARLARLTHEQREPRIAGTLSVAGDPAAARADFHGAGVERQSRAQTSSRGARRLLSGLRAPRAAMRRVQWSRIWKKRKNLESFLKETASNHADFAFWNCQNAGCHDEIECGELSVVSGEYRGVTCVSGSDAGRASNPPSTTRHPAVPGRLH